MSVRDAVARTEQGNGAPARVSTADVVKEMISRQAKALAAVLPDHLDADRYARLTLTAVKANPRLMAAFATEQGQVSVLLSAMQAAALGLEPNTPTQECWLQPRRKKDNNVWVDECELSIGYKGYAKLARRSGTVKEIVAEVVHDGDEFEFARGLIEDTFHHKPTAPDGAPLTHVYALARLTNGGAAWVVLNRAQVEKRRAMSESWKNDKSRPYSPWTLWTEEQWCKTAIRHLLTHGQVELSPELARAASSDEQPLQVDDDGMIDALVIDEPRAIEPPAAPEPESEGEPPVPPEAAKDAAASRLTASNQELALLAGKAFPCDDAPKGEKTRQRDRLRHALTYVATGGQEWHLDRLADAQRLTFRQLLEQVIDGTITFAVDWTDQGGVDFTRGDETHTVEWAQLADRPEQEPGE